MPQKPSTKRQLVLGFGLGLFVGAIISPLALTWWVRGQ